ncbi:MAG: NAD(P)-dependent oxidoreductase [Candidatus Heimdallarchaeota archaeon]|nr:NAD(P)-dependent oxidoreductase [Candidatus Heimdallarchaeota archaeon]
MKILLTGAFGNVGEHTLVELSKKDYQIRCFDIKERKTKRVHKSVSKKCSFETIWGDIRDKEIVNEIVKDIDCIIHLAAIIPPRADDEPVYALEVNVEGTRNLIEAASKEKKPPKFIFTSSIALYGSRMHVKPPRKVGETPKPIDHDEYAKHKLEMEEILQKSPLRWVILRMGAIPSLRMPIKVPPLMYEVPFDQRLEFIDPRDAGLACVNAIEADIEKTIMNAAGGKRCQITAGDYIYSILNSFGVGTIPKEVFKYPNNDDDWFHTDFMYTKDSQEILQYQRYNMDDFTNEFEKRIWFLRRIIGVFSPLAKLFLILRSPYYFKNKKQIRKKQVTYFPPIFDL